MKTSFVHFEWLASAISLSALLISISCAHKPVDAPASPPKKIYISQQNPKLDRSDLKSTIESVLSLANIHDVFVSVNPETGYVHLSGGLPGEAKLQELLDVVGSIKGVGMVQNSLYVSEPPKVAHPLEEQGFWSKVLDSWLYLLAVLVTGILIYSVWRARVWAQMAEKLKRQRPLQSN